MDEVLHELLSLTSSEIILQVNAPSEEMELLTFQNNETISIKTVEMDETVLAILNLIILELSQTRVSELPTRPEEMGMLSLEKPEMMETLSEEMADQTCD